LNRTTKTVTLTSTSQIPSINEIRKLPREKILRLVFEESVHNQKETVGQQLKKALPDFVVGIHLVKPEIKIARLITDKEIEDHQDFFEMCAQDYRALSEYLIFKLANRCKIEIDEKTPMESFYKLQSDERQTGSLGHWRYFLHGIHCGFAHTITGQAIEVCLVYGYEFGSLDPYFFTRFIKSTPHYKPLPVPLYEDHGDGFRIIEKMLSLGRFERVDPGNGFEPGVAAIRRTCADNNVKIKTTKTAQRKFSLLRFLRLK